MNRIFRNTIFYLLIFLVIIGVVSFFSGGITALRASRPCRPPGGLVRRVVHQRLLAPLAQLLQRQVPRDGAQVRPERRALRPERVRPPEDLQEALLGHVFGLGRGAEHPAGEPEHRRPVPLVEQQERGLVPSARPQEQLGFRDAIWHRPPPGGFL